MFYYLSGTVTHIEPYLAVIDCGGVGYACRTTSYTLSALKKGDKGKLFTHLNVREDAMELYGFSTEEERLAYEQLTSVSGVGPKAAISILSALTVERLNKAVLTGDVKSIATAQGVGNKTAARVILELKDHLAKVLGMKAEDLPDVPDGGQDLGDALNALMVLGYTRAEATAALRKIKTAGKSTEELIKEGLKILSKA